jgi:uncharacterized membrane protein
MLREVALLALAILGALDALYFLLVAYRVLQPNPRWMPRALCMDEATCARIVDTREARVLGPPNAAFGFAYYVAIASFASARLAGLAPPALPFAVASLAALALSIYLAWALLGKLRARCTLCFLGHAVNAALFALLATAVA